ncbi:putative selenate ABC transporter substrate-binding protein [Phycisphaeraceae bacterium D3-23]
MLRRTFTKLSLLACIGTFTLAGCGGSSTDTELTNPDIAQDTTNAFSKNTDQELVFSAIPDTAGSELTEKFDKVAEYLSAELGVTVRYQPSPDYGASVEAFTNGDIHFAWFGGLTGVQAMQAVPGSAAIVQGEADPMYYSYFIAHTDSELPEWNGEDGQPFPDAMGGMSFTFGSEKSTSGRLMPEFFIRENTDQSPAEFFDGEPGFSGSHDNTVSQVNSGAYMVGAVNYKVYTRMSEAGEAPNAYIVWKTPYYADYNLTARGDLDETFGEGSMKKLQEVLVALDDPALLSAFDRDNLIEATNGEFQGIVDVAESLGFLE